MSEEAAVETSETAAPAEAAEITKEVEVESSSDGKWFDALPDDDKAYLSKKGWDRDDKGPADVLKSYRALEKMKGDPDRALTLPDPENEEEVNAFYAKMGVPEAPDGYETPPVEVSGQPLDTGVLTGLSHKARLTPDQHRIYSEGVAEYLQSAEIQMAEEKAARDTAEKVEMEAAWAGLKDENYQAATRAAKQFGVDADTLNAIQSGIGYRATIELFTKIGRSFGEGKAPEPAGTNGTSAAPFGVTPTVAKERLNELMKDQGFRDRMEKGDTDAREQWDRLKTIAFTS